MHERCSHCGLKYEREPGYFLGSIYFNYGLTALLVTAGYLGFWFAGVMSPEMLLGVLVGFSIVFPMVFFRWARALWMGLDQFYDPRKGPTRNEGTEL